MIEAEHSLVIESPIDRVWDYVQDIRRWANLFPGSRECVVLNDRDSRWVLKVGAGGLVRTVNVLVHVDEWDGPERVNFSYKLEGDPVEGSGSYVASRKTSRETEVSLKVRVVGSGSMAPMWEAMSKPLLPQLAKTFAGQLKREIEQASRAEPEATPPESFAARISIFQRLRNLWRAVFRSAQRQRS